jgi:predicted nucleotidyltransferase
MDAVPDARIARWAAELDDDNVVAITLAGSYARGYATRYSDVDLIVYQREMRPADEDYSLRYRGETLVSITRTTLDAKHTELSRPDAAIWCVPGLRQARVLLDKEGAFAALQAEAFAWTWTPSLQAQADAFASAELAGYAEEAHKILGGLLRDDDSQMVYGSYGMVLGISRLVSTARGTLIESENVYFRQLQEVMGLESRWSAAFRTAAGLNVGGTPRMRGLAALELYVETARLLEGILEPEHRAVVEGAVRLIEPVLNVL